MLEILKGLILLTLFSLAILLFKPSLLEAFLTPDIFIILTDKLRLPCAEFTPDPCSPSLP